MHITEKHCAVRGRRMLARGAFVLEIARNSLHFNAGEHILLGVADDSERREYSIYSGEQDDTLAVLVKQVAGGSVSQRLATVPIGNMVAVEGPLGYFTIAEDIRYSRRHIFIASGSGIAPYHAFVRSYPQLQYHIIHGTRYADEQYDAHDYPQQHYTHCVSRDETAGFRGRVTDYLRQHPVDVAAYYYLCGNCDMIYEVFDILQSKEVPIEQIAAEVYF